MASSYSQRWREPTLRRDGDFLGGRPGAAIGNRSVGGKQLYGGTGIFLGGRPGSEVGNRARVKKLLFPLNPNHWQWKTQPQFILEIDFHVMKSKLLELNAAKIMDVRSVAFHLL